MKINRSSLKARLVERMREFDLEDEQRDTLASAYETERIAYAVRCAEIAIADGKVIDGAYPVRPYRSTDPHVVNLAVTYQVDQRLLPSEPKATPATADWIERNATKTLLNILELSTEDEVTLSAAMVKHLANINLPAQS